MNRPRSGPCSPAVGSIASIVTAGAGLGTTSTTLASDTPAALEATTEYLYIASGASEASASKYWATSGPTWKVVWAPVVSFVRVMWKASSLLDQSSQARATP